MNLLRTTAYSALLTGLVGLGAAHADPAAPATAAVASVAADEGIVVTAKRNRIPTLTDVAGETQVLTADRLEAGRAATIADALRYVPGLFVQSATGEEATRFSMRGSGIIRAAGSWGTGIQFLFNGLTLTSPEGSPFEYYEPLANNYTEIYPGANAFEYSPSTQGGAINFVEHTGYDSTPLLGRVEGGSFGYNREQVSSGQVIGPLDYYVSYTHFGSDGFRVNNSSYSERVEGDVGYKFSPDLKTRIFFEDAAQNTRSAASLTLAQALSNPTSNSYTNTWANYTGAKGTTVQSNRREKGSTIFGDETTYDINANSSFEGGFLYKNFPLRNQGGGYTPGDWDVKDLAVTLRYKRHDQIFGGHENDSEIAWVFSDVLPDSTNRGFYANPNLFSFPIEIFKATFAGFDNTVLVKDDLETVKNLWLTVGLASISQKRVSDISIPSYVKYTALPGQPLDRTENYYTFAPRFGLRYDVTHDVQLYANFSRSDEAPIAHQLPETSVTTVTGGVVTTKSATVSSIAGIAIPNTVTAPSVDAGNADIKNQTQNTWEAGVRGQYGIVKWDVAGFYARIQHEILTQVVGNPNANPVITITSNSTSPTIHEGIEGTADVTLYKDGARSLIWRSAITLDRFQFVNDAVYHNNELPGVPEQFYQGGLDYNDPSGFYAGVTTESLFKAYAADFYNTISVPAYTIFGARLGFRSPDKKWEFFLQGDNLGDKHYIAEIAPTGLGSNAQHQNTAAIYNPGETRNISVGLTHAFF
jgi:iron complex outermembrane receptor protein